MTGAVTDLFTYPIKGLSPHRLQTVRLTTGRGFPHDRQYAFARHDSGFDPKAFSPLPKHNFFMLMKDERLAALDVHFDPVTMHLTIGGKGVDRLSADLSTADGITLAEDYLRDLFALDDAERPVFAGAGDHRFTDVSVVSEAMMNAVSLINLASVRDLEKSIGTPVDPLRFRANIYFDGWAPLQELEFVDREITVGPVRMRIILRTQRCAATEVNPQTAERDISVPVAIRRIYGHMDMGVYAEILEPGAIRPGDPVRLAGAKPLSAVWPSRDRARSGA